MKPLNVLITGCGGDIAQSIAKILSECDFVQKLVGTDMEKNHFGILVFENFEFLPPCNTSEYYSQLDKIINRHEIHIIIPTSEPEIKEFFKQGCKTFYKGIPLLIASEEALAIGFDKLETVKFLKGNSLDFPDTTVISEASTCTLPSILKSRIGSGSKKIFKIETEFDFAYFKHKYPDFIIQEYLAPDDEEYTCGLFRSKAGKIITIVFKRRLIGDSTGYGETVKDKSIESLLVKIAETINLCGSINVQLRNTNRGPVVFEINPRFSSTVLFRHMLGYQDLVWSIKDIFGELVLTEIPDFSGRKIYRGYEMRVV
jgi:carbamoyl-phosphate synthase large subunit